MRADAIAAVAGATTAAAAVVVSAGAAAGNVDVASAAEEGGVTFDDSYLAEATAVGMNRVVMNLSKFGISRICFFSCMSCA